MASLPLRGQIAALLRLGLPLVGSQLAQVSINITDTMMLGRYDVAALAAAVLANALFFTIFLFGSGFAWALTPMVASAIAQGDTIRVRRVTRMALWASAGFSVLALPVLLSSAALFRAIGQMPDLAALAGDYLDIAGWGLIPALGVMVLRGFLAGRHRTGIVLWVTLGASVLNALFDWILIFGHLGFPAMGVRGAAIASVAMQLASFVCLVVFVRRTYPDEQLFVRLWRPDWHELGQVVRLGWPIGMAALAEAGLFSAAAIMVGWIGEIALAAHGIALQIATITFMMHVGMAQAATVLAAGAHGAGDPVALRRVGQAALVVAAAISVWAVVVMLSLPETLIGLFLNPAEPQRAAILAVGLSLIVPAAIFQGADGVQVVMISLLRGIHDTRVPMILAAVSYWVVGAPLGLIIGIGLDFGAVGIWSGLVAGLFAAALLLGWRFWRVLLPRMAAARAT